MIICSFVIFLIVSFESGTVSIMGNSLATILFHNLGPSQDMVWVEKRLYVNGSRKCLVDLVIASVGFGRISENMELMMGGKFCFTTLCIRIRLCWTAISLIFKIFNLQKMGFVWASLGCPSMILITFFWSLLSLSSKVGDECPQIIQQ